MDPKFKGMRTQDAATQPSLGRTQRGGIALALILSLATVVPASGSSDSLVGIIVRESAPASNAAELAVTRLGGTVGRQLGIIGGFSARVGSRMLDTLRGNAAFRSISTDGSLSLHSVKVPDLVTTPPVPKNPSTEHATQTTQTNGGSVAGSEQHSVDGFDPRSAGGWAQSIEAMRADDMWRQGNIGQGVDVALIDSGVSPVPGLTGQVIDGPDLSFESQFDETRYLDTYGHGTHMASIIAGRDASIEAGREFEDYDDAFVGIAPGSRVLSMKVATANGAVDVSQVIAAIDWVVQHRNTDGLNVRVLNLSFGTDSLQPYEVDPLAFAVEVAWLRGIVVVAAAGNGGIDDTSVNDPAYDPYVIAASAVDSTTGHPKDYTTPSWQTRGDASRSPDLAAPGRSVVGLRVPESAADQGYPSARVGTTARFFKGSGSSQATAFISGAAALLLSQRPELTPDQVKAILTSTAQPLPSADPVAQGRGLVDLHAARKAPTPPTAVAEQRWPRSTGDGSLEAARGGYHVSEDGVELTGEQDIFGNAWDGRSWSEAAWDGRSWSGGDWNGSTWSGSSWSGSSWSGRSWSGSTWSGRSWSGRSWSGRSWSGSSWSGRSWSGRSWSGSSWSGSSWSGRSWSARSWSSEGWG